MRVVRPGARREVVPSGLLGMVIFVGTEVMFFAGLISAFTISKAGAPRDAWNLPAGQVLPLASTAVNTAALFVSAALLLVAGRQYPGTFLGRHADPARGGLLRSAVRDAPGQGMGGPDRPWRDAAVERARGVLLRHRRDPRGARGGCARWSRSGVVEAASRPTVIRILPWCTDVLVFRRSHLAGDLCASLFLSRSSGVFTIVGAAFRRPSEPAKAGPYSEHT